jgi:signal transduction histidine kinase
VTAGVDYVRPVSRRDRLIDAAVAAALTLATQVELWTGSDLADKRLAASLTTLVATGLLVVRRTQPLLCGVGSMAVLVIQQATIGDVQGASAFSVVALVIAMYSLGAFAPLRQALPSGIGCVIALCIVSIAKGKPIGDITFVSIVIFAPWIAGMVIHRRHLRERELTIEGEKRARTAVEEERARIARELHDVVAHAMSVIVVQAGAERMVLGEGQESTRAVLEGIESTGRQALGEMRRLLGMMRAGNEELALAPQPSVEHLPDLCEQVSAAGLSVELVVEGDPAPLPPGVDVSAYRIVQEALTNALKHAGPASARVAVRYAPTELEVEVVDDGRGAAAVEANGGHGLIGMRERVTVYGGRLETGNRDAGGYAVRVRLPLSGTTP